MATTALTVMMISMLMALLLSLWKLTMLQLGDTLIVNGQEIALTQSTWPRGIHLMSNLVVEWPLILNKAGNESDTAIASIGVSAAVDAPIITDNVANDGSGNERSVIADLGITNDNTPG
jgi:hypothetical protein